MALENVMQNLRGSPECLESTENNLKTQQNMVETPSTDYFTLPPARSRKKMNPATDPVESEVDGRQSTDEKTQTSPALASEDNQHQQQNDHVSEPGETSSEPETVIPKEDLHGSGQLSLRSHLFSMWYLVVIIITPIACLPLILCAGEKKQARCGYVIAVMTVYWVTECLPIPIASLLPVVLLPSLGVMSAKATSKVYFDDTSMLFVGGLLVAIAIEVWNLHKRIALLVIRIVGTEPRCLLLGITLVTWFLSIWISNTATTALMMTIVTALIEHLEKVKEMPAPISSTDIDSNYSANKREASGQDSERVQMKDPRRQTVKEDPHLIGMGKALSLIAAYAANIGGVASITGTAPNLVFLASVQKLYENVGLQSPVSFSTWLIYGLPLSLVLVIVMWLWMVLVYLRCRGGCNLCCCHGKSDSEETEAVNKALKDEYNKLGTITCAQWSVLISFMMLIVIWATHDLGGIGGWAVLFPKNYVSDSTPSLLFGILMFILPASFPTSFLNGCNKSASYEKTVPLLTWKQVHEKMPWSLYLLLGGGYALAEAATASGLSAWVGTQLLVFKDLNKWTILFLVCYIVTFATEVITNTATATLMMPILSQMALSLQLNPLFLMFPAAIATSFAFMLPVATPPNAIVFSHGRVRVIDMVISGWFLNIISVPILMFATATWGNAYFSFDQFPEQMLNRTTV